MLGRLRRPFVGLLSIPWASGGAVAAKPVVYQMVLMWD